MSSTPTVRSCLRICTKDGFFSDPFAARDLVAHFTRVGTPITTGGGELAHTM
jgi:hypothetical protein